jgi:hypothetical protein
MYPCYALLRAFLPHALLPQAIRANLSQEELQELLQETEAVLDDDAQVGGDSTVTRVQRIGKVVGRSSRIEM